MYCPYINLFHEKMSLLVRKFQKNIRTEYHAQIHLKVTGELHGHQIMRKIKQCAKELLIIKWLNTLVI